MKNPLMNQMNPMNLFQGIRYIKKYFFDVRGGLWRFLGSFTIIGAVLARFDLININKLIFISSLDEPNVLG